MVLRIAGMVVALPVGDSLTGADAQTVTRGQATSLGQSRADNRLPQPPSRGTATGKPAQVS